MAQHVVFNPNLIKLLQCPHCKEYMAPPIYDCVNGHNFCTKCFKKLGKCGTCRQPRSDKRNEVWEELAGYLTYPCAYTEDGCSFKGPWQDVKKHEDSCHWGYLSNKKLYYHEYIYDDGGYECDTDPDEAGKIELSPFYSVFRDDDDCSDNVLKDFFLSCVDLEVIYDVKFFNWINKVVICNIWFLIFCPNKYECLFHVRNYEIILLPGLRVKKDFAWNSCNPTVNSRSQHYFSSFGILATHLFLAAVFSFSSTYDDKAVHASENM